MKRRLTVLSIVLTLIFVIQSAWPAGNVFADRQAGNHSLNEQVSSGLADETVSQSVYDNTLPSQFVLPELLTGIGIKAEYFGDRNFSELLATRVEDRIDYEKGLLLLPDWHEDRSRSVRWSGTLTAAYSEEYTFKVEALGDYKLWIDDQLLIDSDDWFGNRDKARMTLQAGIPVQIKMEFQSGLLGGYVKLLWSSKSQHREVVQKPYLNPPYIPGIPQGIATIAKSSQSIQIAWNPVEGATGYDVEVDGNVIDNGADTAFVQEQLLPNSQHIYRIRAKAPGIAGEWSAPYSERTVVGSPMHVTAEAGPDSIAVQWDPADGAIGYEVEADGIVISVGLETDYHHAGLMPNTMHTYRVRTIGESGSSEWSEFIEKTVQTMVPMHLQVEPASTSITLSWESVTGATGYEVEADGAVIGVGEALAYAHSDLTPNSQHRYRVRALLGEQPGEWSTYVTASTSPAPGSGTGLKGDYYTNENMDHLAASRIDPNIDFDWKNRSPIDGSFLKQYAVRWTGQIEARYSEKYTLMAEAHGGVRVWVNDELLIDEWRFNGMHWGSGEKRLEAGHKYDIRVEYRKPMGAATMKLYWKSDSQRTEIIPQSQLYPIGMPGGVRTDSNETSVTIQWDTVTFAAGYEVEADGVIADAGNSTSYVHGPLVPGTLHNYRVRAVNGVAVGEWSPTVSRTTRLGTSAIAAMQAEETRIDVYWAEVAGATGYDIEVDGIIHDNGIQTAYSHLDLRPGTEHRYRVRAKTAAVIGDWTPIAGKWTLPDVPANLRASSTGSSIEVSWDPVVGANRYEVEAYDSIIDVGGKTTYSDFNINPNSQHAYRVRAVNDSGAGKWSPVFAKRTLPAPPSHLRGIAKSTSIQVMWDPTSGAESYELEIDGGQLKRLDEFTFEHADLVSNSVHTYRVRSYGSEGVSEWSDPIDVATLPFIPQGLQARVSGSSIVVSWNPVEGAAGYDLEVHGAIIDIGSDTHYSIEGVEKNAQYQFRIRARNLYQDGEWSDPVGTVARPGIPTNVKASVAGTQVTVTWDPVVGAIAYEVDADGEIVRSESATYSQSQLPMNSEHQYRVRALNAGGAGEWSDYVSAEVRIGAPANLRAVSITGKSIELAWDPVAGASGYDLFMDGTLTDAGVNTTYAHSELEPHTTHIYRVRARTANRSGEWSDTLALTTKLAVPVNLTGRTKSDRVDIRWDTVTGATYYAIEIDNAAIEFSEEASYGHINLKPNTAHSYRVRALNDVTDSDWSEAATFITAPGIPGQITTVPESKAIRVSWDSVAGAVAYRIEVDGNVLDVSSNAYLHADLKPNTMHVYRVTAVGAGGTSDWSEFVKASTTSELQVNAGKDTMFNFLVIAPAQSGVNQRKITVHYDPNELEVIDIAAQTPNIELAPGGIEGTSITVLRHDHGEIVFLINDADKTVVNVIKFMALISGYSQIDYEIE